MTDSKFTAPTFEYPGKPETERPATGNIYCDTWYFNGERYRSYYIDCAQDYDCGTKQIALHPARRLTATNDAKQKGWTKSKKHGKWLCPVCSERARNEQ